MDVVTRGDPGYPPGLLDLEDAPRRIWLEGQVPDLSRSVAIVGSRQASERGRDLAERMAHDIALRGLTVVSGGALGIDTAAHAGALRAKGSTLVVLPTPIDSPHPAVNRAMFARVVERGGALLSEYEGPTRRSAFRTRNRLIAALAEVVVVVEAGERSGTRYTVRAARRLGRRVVAVPWDVGDPLGAGANEILSTGGHAVRSSKDVLRLLGLRPARTRARAPPEDAGDLTGRIRALLSEGPRSVDQLSAALDQPVAELLVALTTLEIAGAIEARGNGRFAERGRG